MLSALLKIALGITILKLIFKIVVGEYILNIKTVIGDCLIFKIIFDECGFKVIMV